MNDNHMFEVEGLNSNEEDDDEFGMNKEDLSGIYIYMRKKSLGEVLGNYLSDNQNMLREDEIKTLREFKKRKALQNVKKRKYSDLEFEDEGDVNLDGIGTIKKVKGEFDDDSKKNHKKNGGRYFN